jgi:hypothetical protein
VGHRVLLPDRLRLPEGRLLWFVRLWFVRLWFVELWFVGLLRDGVLRLLQLLR